MRDTMSCQKSTFGMLNQESMDLSVTAKSGINSLDHNSGSKNIIINNNNNNNNNYDEKPINGFNDWRNELKVAACSGSNDMFQSSDRVIYFGKSGKGGWQVTDEDSVAEEGMVAKDLSKSAAMNCRSSTVTPPSLNLKTAATSSSETENLFRKYNLFIKNETVVVTRLDGVMTSSGERVSFYKCHFCGKLLNTLERLKRHLSMHCRKHPYACKLCDVRFQFRAQELYHRKTHHSTSPSLKAHTTNNTHSTNVASDLLQPSEQAKHSLSAASYRNSFRDIDEHHSSARAPEHDTGRSGSSIQSPYFVNFVESDRERLDFRHCDVDPVRSNSSHHDVQAERVEEDSSPTAMEFQDVSPPASVKRSSPNPACEEEEEEEFGTDDHHGTHNYKENMLNSSNIAFPSSVSSVQRLETSEVDLEAAMSSDNQLANDIRHDEHLEDDVTVVIPTDAPLSHAKSNQTDTTQSHNSDVKSEPTLNNEDVIHPPHKSILSGHHHRSKRRSSATLSTTSTIPEVTNNSTNRSDGVASSNSGNPISSANYMPTTFPYSSLDLLRFVQGLNGLMTSPMVSPFIAQPSPGILTSPLAYFAAQLSPNSVSTPLSVSSNSAKPPENSKPSLPQGHYSINAPTSLPELQVSPKQWDDITSKNVQNGNSSWNSPSSDSSYANPNVKCSSLSRTHSRLDVVRRPIKREDACKPIVMADGRTAYHCFYCKKNFCTISDVNRHMDFHEDIRPYKCRFCNYYARTNSQLKVHMMRHQGIREFLCRLCNYKGVTQSDLNRHTKSQIHMMKARNECTHCSEGFVSPINLAQHCRDKHMNTA